MRLTILVPFIGSFLLFNEVTVRLLSLPSFTLKDFGMDAPVQTFPKNLYFTYFGLCSLGIGSILFSFFCPTEIADEINIKKFVIDSPSSSDSPVIAKDDFHRVLNIRFEHIYASDDDTERLDYPDELKGNFDSLMGELYKSFDLGDAVDGDDYPSVMLPTGYLESPIGDQETPRL
ncbi:hypothetical protein ACSBOB_06675 [Mesorhizobium sp. ASY16-5R]|uniref:hypothetical protein n=1 Tax=Mesorhizobium sp. ASY16-5R TaxID=3445772 RepID=UPI003FA0B2CA